MRNCPSCTYHSAGTSTSMTSLHRHVTKIKNVAILGLHHLLKVMFLQQIFFFPNMSLVSHIHNIRIHSFNLYCNSWPHILKKKSLCCLLCHSFSIALPSRYTTGSCVQTYTQLLSVSLPPSFLASGNTYLNTYTD